VKDKDFFPVVVVANKCDLEYERQVQPHGMSSSSLKTQFSPDIDRGTRLGKAIQRTVYRDFGQTTGQRRRGIHRSRQSYQAVSERTSPVI
jgi:GTPase SAR1 family protein